MTIYRVREGSTSYGHEIGILLVQCSTPFIPGDVGNASTYPFPVLYREMEGCTLDRLINKGDATLEEGVIEAARSLEAHGVHGITSDCGFMIRFQNAVAKAVSIPVFLSPLLQLPLILSTFGHERPVGVMTANSERLLPELLECAGVRPEDPVPVYGLQDSQAFRGPILDENQPLDPAAIEKDMVAVAREMLEDHLDMAAIVLECSNMPPYAHAVQAATGLPVFDFTTMIAMFAGANHRTPFKGSY